MQSRHIDVKISYHTQCNRKVKILKGTLLNEMSMGADERRQTDCMRNIEKKKTNEWEYSGQAKGGKRNYR